MALIVVVRAYETVIVQRNCMVLRLGMAFPTLAMETCRLRESRHSLDCNAGLS